MKLSRSTCSRFTMIKTIFVVVSVKRHQIICDFKFPFPLFTSGCSCFCLQTLLICKLSSQLPGKNILLPVYKPASRFQRLQLLLKKKQQFNLALYQTTECLLLSVFFPLSFFLLLTLLFLLFPLPPDVSGGFFPGVAGRLVSAVPVLGAAAAAAAAASGVWDSEEAEEEEEEVSVGEAPLKKTQWSSRRKSLPPRLLPPAPPLWSPAGRSTPAPPTSSFIILTSMFLNTETQTRIF